MTPPVVTLEFHMPILALSLLLLHLSLLPCACTHSQAPAPAHLLKSSSASLSKKSAPAEYFELSVPVPRDHQTPPCSLTLLQHDFGKTIGAPPVSVPYSPPSDCPPPWTSVALHLAVSSRGEQYDRIAAVWIDGVEILRTSTAEPTKAGVYWSVRKDVSRFASVLRRPDATLSMMLENVLDHDYTGIYHVNMSLDFYPETGGKIRLFESEIPDFRRNSASELLYAEPADLVIPIAADGVDDGYWFRIQNESDLHSKEVEIPRNAWAAVLEICVSFHGDDEFWYSNPPDAYIEFNNLETKRGNGAFRQVVAGIDGAYAGSVVPFPVVFTGGINPLFWEPVVAIGAFNLPSYDLDLTPFLGRLLDGKSHSFSLSVTGSIPFWLVNANLHLWLDRGSSHVRAALVRQNAPGFSITRESNFLGLDGKFIIEAEREAEFVGWVKSSAGNLTTHVHHEFKFKNKIKFKNNGTFKETEQKIKASMEVKRVEGNLGVLSARSVYKSKYPIRIKTRTLPVNRKSYSASTNLSHTRYEKSSVTSNHGVSSWTLSNTQNSRGWMEVRGHSIRSGNATTQQSYRYRDDQGCYSRNVMGSSGKVLADDTTTVCSTPL
ncbi:hypothetical protein ACLOJK_023361 [Asimina triloba]